MFRRSTRRPVSCAGASTAFHGRMKPGGNSWNGLPTDVRTGGSIWTAGSYDPGANLYYIGPAPTYDTGPLLQPSGVPDTTNDALYTNATVAIVPETGEIAWHFQHVRNDPFDLDWAFERMLLDPRGLMAFRAEWH